MLAPETLPEGFATLTRLEHDAPNYNAWLGRRLRPELGKRVLEVGAGIGTITRQILPGRELVIALEAEPAYAVSLREAFKEEPRVRTVHSAVERIDWTALAQEDLDSVLLSNVLEHIADDSTAVSNFRRVLRPGGRLVLLVPALPKLFGTLDEAVGHYRRYLPRTLRAVLEANDFEVVRLEWMNLLGIPGWFLNSCILKRRVIPMRQLRAYDRIAPLLAKAESVFSVPVGMSLFAVATAV